MQSQTKTLEVIQKRFSAFFEALQSKQLKKAIQYGEELRQLDAQPYPLYILAQVYLEVKQPQEAMRTLERAVQSATKDPSFRLAEALHRDPELNPLRPHPNFPKLMRGAEKVLWRPTLLHYEAKPATPYPFRRSDSSNAYLAELRALYPLETLVAGARDDLARVKVLCTWVHTRWNHVGDATSQPEDPIGLLKAASKGDNFRCVEYGITVAGCLNAVGIPARVVAARAADVETRLFGAGHVFAEAYLRDRRCWVFVDPQTNVVGEVDGKPVNTVEFRQAMAGESPKVNYDLTLGSCFHYFSYSGDERYPITERAKGSVLLVPLGAPLPRLFQRRPTPPPLLATHNPSDIYAPLEMPNTPKGKKTT